MAGIPSRPAWRDSDPRWRRRMLAGAWILVLLPLMDVLRLFDWASKIPVPDVFSSWGSVRTLDETFLFQTRVYQRLLFCVGVVLMFSKERGRRRGRLDWTRRWGVICTYVVSLLSAAPTLLISALVLTGIAALFQSIPLKYQPRATQFCVDLGAGYLRYGPYPKEICGIALVGFSSIVILLACAPLFDALRSSGSKRAALILLAPLAFFSLTNLAQAGRSYVGHPNSSSREVLTYAWYLRPNVLLGDIADLLAKLNDPHALLSVSFVEITKWCNILAIAIWLTIAQLSASRRRKAALLGSAD